MRPEDFTEEMARFVDPARFLSPISSADAAFNALERAWERQEQESDLECCICERTLSVGEEEAGDYHRDAHSGSRIACWECVQQEVRKERRCEYCFEAIDIAQTAETGCLSCARLEGGAS